uniref:Uncharacterized protein n=1 Tax=Anguilla anguilla TaxID=7936 RepID=A0A0E9XM64_ANGAN
MLKNTRGVTISYYDKKRPRWPTLSVNFRLFSSCALQIDISFLSALHAQVQCQDLNWELRV